MCCLLLQRISTLASLVVQAVRKMDLPSWLPLRELSSWSDHAEHTTATRGRLQGFLREDEGRHPRRRPRESRNRH